MDDAIAGDDIIGVRPSGERITIKLRLGRPYRKDIDPDTWACPVSLEPLYSRIPDVVGDSSFQSLCLAARLALYLLDGLKQDGGRVLCDDSTDFPFDAYAFIDPGARRGPSEA